MVTPHTLIVLDLPALGIVACRLLPGLVLGDRVECLGRGTLCHLHNGRDELDEEPRNLKRCRASEHVRGSCLPGTGQRHAGAYG